MTALEVGKVEPTLVGSLVSILYLIQSHLKGLNQVLCVFQFPPFCCYGKKMEG